MADSSVPIPPTDIFIDDIRQRISDNQLVAILGAGVTVGATDGASTASWVGLLESGIDRCVALRQGTNDWAERRKVDLLSGETDEILSVADQVTSRLGGADSGEYGLWLRDAVGSLQVTNADVLDAITRLNVPLVTTNYDGLIERVTGLNPVTWRDRAQVERVLRGEEQGVLHLHGYWAEPESVVLGIRSYEQVMGDSHASAVLHGLRLWKNLLFIGYGAGLTDPNFDTFRRWTRETFSQSEYRHFRLARSSEVEVLQRQHPPEERLFVVSYGENHSDLAPFLARLRKSAAPPSLPSGIELGTLPGPVSNVAPSSLPHLKVRGTLPTRVRSFTGRSQELARIRSTLQNDVVSQPTVLIVHGLSGVGKTQLCRVFLDSNKNRYDLWYWIPADDPYQLTSGLAQLAIDYQLPGVDPGNVVRSSQIALRWLEQRDRWLFVFDNASPETLRKMLPSGPSGHVLVTSTNPHWASVTRHTLRLEGLSSEDAVQFLVTRTTLTHEPAAARLAAKLDYLPLALEQAAAYIEDTGVDFAAYDQLLTQHRPDLLGKKSSLTDYPESVYSALEINVGRASEEVPHVINLLVFLSCLSPSDIPRSLIRDAIENYFEQLGEHFSDLVFNEMISRASKVSLLVAEDGLISTHSLVQAFVRDIVPPDYHAGWVQFTLSVLAHQFPAEVDDSAQWPRCELLIEHVVSAMVLAEYRSWGDEDIEALYVTAGSYLHARGRDEQACDLLRCALEQAKARWGKSHPEVARVSNNYMNALSALGRVEEALRLGHEAVSILSQTTDIDDVYINDLGILYSNIGRIYLHYRKDFYQARYHILKALSIHLDLLGREHYTVAIDINNLGTIDREEAAQAFARGDVRKARTKWAYAYGHFELAVQIHRKVLPGSDYRLAVAVFNLGTAAYNLGRYQEAEACYREAVRINDQLKGGATQWDQNDALFHLGETLRTLGRPREAIVCFDRALEIARSLYGRDARVVKSIQDERGAAAFDLIRRFFCYYT